MPKPVPYVDKLELVRELEEVTATVNSLPPSPERNVAITQVNAIALRVLAEKQEETPRRGKRNAEEETQAP